MMHEFSRRRFGKVLAGGSVLAFDAVTRGLAAADETPEAIFENLPPLDGTMLLDEAARRTSAQDYGQIVHERPLAVLRPGSVQDIAKVVRFARRYGLRIAARGQGHLPFGQAQVPGGIVVDMRSLGTVHSVHDGHVDVDAGADWRTVVRATLSHGLTPPVLPAYLGLTVGGTLSIGGVGAATFRYGAQVDHVFEAQVVTGDGEVVTCSSTEHRDLFEAMLAGQGQVAIIVRVIMRLVAAPAMIREYRVEYPDLPTLARDGFRLTEDARFDGVSAFLVPGDGDWSYSLVATSYFTAPAKPDSAASMADLGHLPGSERITDVGYLPYMDGMPNVELGPSHPDLALCIPGSVAPSFIEELLPRLTPDDLGTGAEIRLSFWKQDRFARPLFRIPVDDTFLYMVLRRTETDDPDVVARMLRGNRILFDRNRALGGTHYPFSALELSRHDWQRHYGAWWSALAGAKRRYDPDRVFASGPDLFGGQRG